MWLAQAFRQVHAFEPLGRHADLFRHNVPDPNVILHEIALGAEAGVCEVLSVRKSSGDAFIKPGIGAIEISALDSFAFTEVDFIKIDVEGFERQVVEGARETLLINHPIICVEQKDKDTQNFGAPSKGALAYLLELGMELRLEIHGDYILGWPD
jgi:FkbM family methyltransferase